MSVVPVLAFDSEDPRTVALALAVMHHGLSNLAEGSIPSRTDTVLETASMFERHLNGEEQPPSRPQGQRRH